ncbi:Pancreatic progenitor cell differentiation and proliferation factor-like, partial [Pterocles gutturalis]
AGCLLAKKQFYRSKCSGGPHPGPPPRRVLPVCYSASLMVWDFSPLAGLPELIDNCWWIKSFFHSEPSLPTVGRKTLSAS